MLVNICFLPFVMLRRLLWWIGEWLRLVLSKEYFILYLLLNLHDFHLVGELSNLELAFVLKVGYSDFCSDVDLWAELGVVVAQLLELIDLKLVYLAVLRAFVNNFLRLLLFLAWVRLEVEVGIDAQIALQLSKKATLGQFCDFKLILTVYRRREFSSEHGWALVEKVDSVDLSTLMYQGSVDSHDTALQLRQ